MKKTEIRYFIGGAMTSIITDNIITFTRVIELLQFSNIEYRTFIVE